MLRPFAQTKKTRARNESRFRKRGNSGEEERGETARKGREHEALELVALHLSVDSSPSPVRLEDALDPRQRTTRGSETKNAYLSGVVTKKKKKKSCEQQGGDLSRCGGRKKVCAGARASVEFLCPEFLFPFPSK